MSERSADLGLSILDRLPWRRQKTQAAKPDTQQNGFHPPVHIPMERLEKIGPNGRKVTILYRNSLTDGINYHQDPDFEANIVPGVD